MGGHARSQSLGKRRLGARPGPGPETTTTMFRILHDTWGEAACELHHSSAFQLLVAAILNTQSPRRRIVREVNRVTPHLFARYPTPRALARAGTEALEAIIRPTGFYRFKAKQLRAAARALIDEHDGEVPQTMGALARLPGVSRKVANVVLSNYFGVSVGMVVDIHVRRVSRRLGLTDASDAAGVERDLLALLPKERRIDVANEFIWHGRRVCHARNPTCDACPLASVCPSADGFLRARAADDGAILGADVGLGSNIDLGGIGSGDRGDRT